MQTRTRDIFTTVRTEGAILPIDILQRIVSSDGQLDGMKPQDYHLTEGEKIREAVSRSWNRLLGVWTSFNAAAEKLPAGDLGTTITRERWLLPLFQELGYGRLLTAKAVELDGRSYPISHFWQNTAIHLVGCRVDTDKRTPGAVGAARISPHGMVQEFLNRSDDHLWAFLSNGVKLRILRDNVSLTRQAYVEFDLAGMMEGEVYADFVLLWLLCHQSRVEADIPEKCWLERWSQIAQTEGTRALDKLREGVEKAIATLGSGFLSHRANSALREKLTSGALDKQDYYRQLLRVVYRLIFLFVAEDRGLLLQPDASPEARDIYTQYYSSHRLRHLAERKRGTKHHDLWQGLSLVFNKLGSDEGCPDLALPALGSYLWSRKAITDLNNCLLANGDLLEAVRSLAYTHEKGVRRVVDYRNLGSEELGSIYESLLELHPDIHAETGTFELRTAGGHERKTTGSYYTPSSLVNCLLDSALDPVLSEAAKKKAAEQAILNLEVCDPACGSGHFLVAAAHRMAKRLAAVRTGDDEPSPKAMNKALRDVIGRCIYGVDINPMAVELCKVSLWMEALEPGKPLSFLDHHIQCGNSLLGTTPALLAKGIPDEAFKPIEGDDKKLCAEYRKKNKAEGVGQLTLFDAEDCPWEHLGNLAASMMKLDTISDETVAGLKRKQDTYEKLIRSSGYEHSRFLADAWCAAFVWKKTSEFAYPITNGVLRRIERNPRDVAVWMKEEIKRLAEQYQFFHWHLAFPDVFHVPSKGEMPENEHAGWSGGFDVVLGNPPWERIKLQEKEWFADRRPDIANAPNASARRRMIAEMESQDPELYQAFIGDRRQSEGESCLVRDTGRFPLCGRGDVNTYAVFAELKRSLIGSTGYVGSTIPSGIATDDTTKFFFQDLVETQSLVSFFEFENEGFFLGAGQGHMVRFALTTISGSKVKSVSTAFLFQGKEVAELGDADRRFTLTAEDIILLNPNTRTCPIFRTKRDAEITKAIYRRVPVLINEGARRTNPWGISFMTMFHMANDSGLFRTREQLEAEGWQLDGNVFVKAERRYLPLYEAKMIYQFNHRFGDFADGEADRRAHVLPPIPTERLIDPMYVVSPHYWVSETVVKDSLQGKWGYNWLIGWRDVTDARASARTVIFSLLPRVAVGHTFPLMLPHVANAEGVGMLAANLNSFVLDYCARQKVGGLHLTYGYLAQLPVLPPSTYEQPCQWAKRLKLSNSLLARVLELTYTAWDLQAFAKDCDYDGPPFKWDKERRFLLRCELDAAYFHLYDIKRDDVDYIMETFPIVKRKDEAAHGEYRTKRVILEIYDEMKQAMETSQP